LGVFILIFKIDVYDKYNNDNNNTFIRHFGVGYMSPPFLIHQVKGQLPYMFWERQNPSLF